jgi:hypothetical protein
MDTMEDFQYEFALEKLNEILDSYIVLAKQGITDLNHLKLSQPSKDIILPESIFQTMKLFLQLHQKYIDGPPNLMNIVLFSLLNTFPTSDSEVAKLMNKKDEFIMLVFQLYMSIYGLTNRVMYGELLNAPQQSESPIHSLVYFLELYQSSTMYCHQIFRELKVVQVVSRIIDLYDQIDLQQRIKSVHDTEEVAILFRDCLCRDDPVFQTFIRDHVNPFLFTMKKLKTYHTTFLEQDPMTADERYRTTYGQEHLANVNKLFYDTSQLLRNIESIPKKTTEQEKSLCLDIAFAIEVRLGLREPLNQLFNAATSIVGQYISKKRKAIDRFLDLEQHIADRFFIFKRDVSRRPGY